MKTRLLGGVLLLATGASAQEAISVPAATMPSPGVFIPRVVTQLIGYADPTTGESKTHGVQNASLDAGNRRRLVVDVEIRNQPPIRRSEEPTRPPRHVQTPLLSKGSGDHFNRKNGGLRRG